MGIEKKAVSLRMDEQVIEDLRAVAGKQNRSLSNLIETVLKQYLARLQESDQ